jgi:hypothetical protein
MTERQRVLAILNGKQPDQVPWFADLDYWATAQIRRGERPKDFKQSDAYLAWHADLGAGFYMQGYYPFRETPEGCRVEVWRDGAKRYRSISTPKGTLRECWQWSDLTFSESPVEYLVKSLDDLAAYRFYHEHLRYEPNYDRALLRRRQIGENGVVVCYTPHTPFMNLVSTDAGIETVVEMCMDAEPEFQESIEVIKRSMDRAVDLAVNSPAEIVMIPENLSSEVVGPSFFESYMRACQEEWVRKIHAAGKFSTMHMDGTLKGLLRQEAGIGFTFIEAMTPAPVGDLPVEEWAGYLAGSKTLAWGGIPGSYFTGHVSDAEFDRFVISVLSVMRREPRYVLGVADQVPPDGLEQRVRRVRELVDIHGGYE